MSVDLAYLPRTVFDGLPRQVRRFASSGPAAPYFYLPCPLCGEMFGGYEWNYVDGHKWSIPDSADPDDLRGSGICMNCTAEARGCRAWGVTCDGSPHADETGEDFDL